MPENLGEVRVNIEEEGAQDAADTIGDAVGGDDGGAGGGGGGTIGGMLGGISTKLAAILGFVAFLATLKPIQEIFKGLQRLFTVAILPLVSLLTTFLRPILQKLLRFIGQLDFDNLLQSLSSNLERVFNQITSDIGRQIAREIPFIGETGATSSVRAGARASFATSQFLVGNPQPAINIALDGFGEQSNTSMSENVADTNSEIIQFFGLGGQ